MRLVAGLVRPRVAPGDVAPRGQAGERGRLVQRADPLAVPRLRDLSAVVVDERHRGVPVPAREVDGRVVRVLGAAELRHQLRVGGVELGERLRGLRDPRRLVLVGAVDDAARAGVVRAPRTACRCSCPPSSGPRARCRSSGSRPCSAARGRRPRCTSARRCCRTRSRRGRCRPRASPRTSSCSRPSSGTGRSRRRRDAGLLNVWVAAATASGQLAWASPISQTVSASACAFVHRRLRRAGRRGRCDRERDHEHGRCEHS